MEDPKIEEPNSMRNLQEEFTETDPLKEKKPEPEDPKASVCKRTLACLKNITVEPVVFFFIFPSILSMMTTQNLLLEKACRVNLNFTSDICDALKNQSVTSQNENEAQVQMLAANAMSLKSTFTATIPSFLGLLVGSWSDRSGRRKFFMLIPVFGQLLVTLNNSVNVYFFYELPMEVLVFSEAIIEGLIGSWCLLFLSTYSFISAITTDESRTYRMGIMNLCLTVGIPIGMGLSGFLMKTVGYYGCYAIAGSVHALNFTYLLFVLKDPPRTKEQKKLDDLGHIATVCAFFDLTNMQETFKVVFKNGPNRRRLRISVLLGVVSILFGPMYGEISVMYLSTRYRFNWDEVKFSIFQAYNFITHTAGTIFSILVFSKYLKWHDAILGIISTLSKIAGSFVYCFAPNERIFFLAPLVEILNGTSLLAMRAIISKLVNTDELGKVNAIFGLTENLMPLLYVPLYTRVYTATMDVLPGFVFLMGAMMTVPAVVVFIWLLYEHRKQLRKTKRDEAQLKE